MKKDTKRTFREMTPNDLEQEIKNRQKLLIKWNYPLERVPAIAGMTATGSPRFECKHPYKKVRKEISVLKTIMKERK